MWAINMIVHPTYERFDAELDLICEYKPRIVITALGKPGRPPERVHSYGGAVFSDVVTPDQARKEVDAGADGLILVASGDGGHTGHYSPFAFVEEVRGFWDGPLILGGTIGGARAIRAALTIGADFAYMGTRFIATRESLVSNKIAPCWCVGLCVTSSRQRRSPASHRIGCARVSRRPALRRICSK